MTFFFLLLLDAIACIGLSPILFICKLKHECRSLGFLRRTRPGIRCRCYASTSLTLIRSTTTKLRRLAIHRMIIIVTKVVSVIIVMVTEAMVKNQSLSLLLLNWIHDIHAIIFFDTETHCRIE